MTERYQRYKKYKEQRDKSLPAAPTLPGNANAPTKKKKFSSRYYRRLENSAPDVRQIVANKIAEFERDNQVLLGSFVDRNGNSNNTMGLPSWRGNLSINNNRKTGMSFDSEGNYKSGYRSDSADYYHSVMKLASKIDSEAKVIDQLIKDNSSSFSGSSFNQDFIDQWNEQKDNRQKERELVIDGAKWENDLFGGFDSEEEFASQYKIATADYNKENNKLLTMKLDLDQYKQVSKDYWNAVGEASELNQQFGIWNRKDLQSANYPNPEDYDDYLRDKEAFKQKIADAKAEQERLGQIMEDFESTRFQAYGGYDNFLKAYNEQEEFVEELEAVGKHQNLLSGVKHQADYDAMVAKGREKGNEKEFDGEKFNHEVALLIEDKEYPIIYRRENMLYGVDAYTTDEAKNNILIAKHMTDDEYNAYLYHVGKGDTDTAQQLLEYIAADIVNREASSNYEFWGGDDAHALGQIALQLGYGVGNWFDSLSAYSGNEKPFDAAARQLTSGMISESLDDKGLGLAGDLAYTIGNQAPSIIASTITTVTTGNPMLGSVVGNAGMGVSAAGNAYYQAKDMGYTDDEAWSYGALVGGSEMVIGTLLSGVASMGGKLTGKGIGALTDSIDDVALRVGTSKIGQIATKTLKVGIEHGGRMVSEFGEEYLQAVLEPWYQNVIFGTDYSVNPFSKEALEAGLLGALSAGVINTSQSAFQTGVNAINKARANIKAGKKLTNADITAEKLKNVGTLFSADSIAHKLAGKVDENTGAYTIGKLFNEMSATMSAQNKAEIVAKLVSQGVTQTDADILVDAVELSMVAGVDVFNANERYILENNPTLSKAVREVLIDSNSTTYQRIEGMKDVRQQVAKYEQEQAQKTATTEQSVEQSTDTATEQTAEQATETTAEQTAETTAEQTAEIATETTAEQTAEIATAPTEAVTEPATDEMTTDVDAEETVTEAVAEPKTRTVKNVVEDASKKIAQEGESAVVSVVMDEDGNRSYKTEDGDTVDAKNAKFKNEDEAVIYEIALEMGLPAAVINYAVREYDSNIAPALEYIYGVRTAYEYGAYGIHQSYISSYALSALSHKQRQDVYDLGKAISQDEVATKQKAIEDKVSKSKNAENKKGKVQMDGKEYNADTDETLTEVQKESVNAAKFLAEVLGNDINLYNSYVATEGKFKGRRVYKKANGKVALAPNGFYNPDGSINIDINAGSNGEGIILETLGHELTHHIRAWSPAKFKVMADFLFDQYDKHGVDTQSLIHEQIAKAKGNGRRISYDTAYEEVVADAFSRMLTDTDAISKLAKTDKGLYNKVKAWIKGIVNKINKLYSRYDPQSKEAQYAKKMNDVASELQRLWLEGLEDASKNYKSVDSSQLNKSGEKALAESSRPKSFLDNIETQEKFSMRSSVEATKDLVAFHNLNAQQMLDALHTGHITMPSIAVTNKGMTDFGEYSIILPREVIDPKLGAKLFGADAWTPTQIKLKMNAKFSTDNTIRTLNRLKKTLGAKATKELLNLNAKEFQKTIKANDGSMYLAFDEHVGMKTAFALENDIITEIPMKNGKVDTVKLQDIISNRVHNDETWRVYKSWLDDISDHIITHYDEAAQEDIIRTMKAQPATNKKFKLSVDGGLIVPAVEYQSVEEAISNKHRLSEDAEAQTQVVADEFLALAEEVARNTGTTIDDVVNAINNAYDSRYSVEDIISIFKSRDISINNSTAHKVQKMYEKSVELPTRYFEAKAQREVGTTEFAGVIIPSNAPQEVREGLAKAGLPTREYKEGQNNKRIEAINSFEQTKFSTRGKGYSGTSMSNNAVEAYKSGEKPLSKWNKQNILEEIYAYADEGIQTKLDNLNIKELTTDELKSYFLKRSSWHHTSKFYNRTDFYDIDENAISSINAEVMNEIKKQRTRKFKTEEEKANAIKNQKALAEAKQIYEKMHFVLGAGVSKYKSLNGLAKAWLDGNVGEAEYQQALNVYDKEMQRLIKQWKHLPEGHWNHETIKQYEANREEALKKQFGRNMPNNNKVIQMLKNSILQRETNALEGTMYSDRDTDGETKKATTSYIVFNSNQAKEITNKTPTSDADIRYSDRDSVDSLLERGTSIQSKINELRKTRKELESSDEFNNLISDVVSAEKETEQTKSINAYKSWIAKTKYDEIVNEIESLQKEHSEINRIISERVKQKAIEDERKKIAESGLSDADYFRKSAIKEFGYTPYFYDAGYMLPNGKLLNFSGEKGKHFGSRGQDHRAIEAVYADASRGKAMLKFMSEGNIRVMAETPGLDISSVAEPTSEQYTVIKKFVREYAKEKYLAVDITDENGNVIGTYGYENNINADRVVNDIKYYFQNGAMREQSSVSRFFYSERDSDGGFSQRSLLANALESAAESDQDRKTLAQYKKNIAMLSETQDRLHKVNTKIKELSSGKGKGDTEQLAKLKRTSKELTDLINRYDKKLFSLESTDSLKRVLEVERKRAYSKATEESKNKLQAYKDKMILKEQKIRDKYQESKAKATEKRSKTEMKNKIKKLVGKLDSLLRNQTKEKHIPVYYQKSVAQMLEVLNLDEQLRVARAEKRMTAAEEKYTRLLEEERAKENPDADLIEYYQQKLDKNTNTVGKVSEAIQLIKDAYHEITTSNDPIYVNNPEVENLLDGYRQYIGDTQLSDMTLQQLDYVYNSFKIVDHMISEANKGHKLNRSKTISDYAEESVGEIRESHKTKTRTLSSVKIGKSEIKIPHMVSNFKWAYKKPWFAFRSLGSKVMNELYDNLRKGEDTWAVDTQNAAKKFEELAKKYDIQKWNFDKKIKCGNVEITLDQLLSLYAYSKREAADKHLAEGGFVFDSSVKLRKGKKGIFEYQITMPEPQTVSKTDMIELMSNLTDDMKAWADEMQDYLSSDLSAIGNEVSRELYGINLFNEKHYFPIKAMQEVLDFNAEKHTDIVPNITNMGMTKPVLPNANNTIVLGGFTDIWARHCNDMAKYHAFALAMDDFTKVYNYGKGAQSFDKSVKVAIKNAKGLGDAANKYIQTFLQDVNGGVRADEMQGIDALISKFKKSSVMASASVIIQQPSAIARAFGMINPKYFVKTDININHAKTVAEMEKYAPIAIVKRLGGFDTNTGGKTSDIILGKDNKGLIKKANKALGYAPQKADELTWCAIWNACKREAKHKYKLEGEELLKKAGEKFTEVVQLTQVYDSVFSRNAMMRSKSKFNKMVTAFMAEPITSLNGILYAYKQMRQGNIKEGVALRSAFFAATVLNSLLSALPYAWRDDDEDETFAEKYISSAVGETVEGLNPITCLPVIKDIYSLMQGYDVERTDMALVSDVIDKVGNIITAYSNREDDMTDEELAEAQKEIEQAWIDAGFELLNLFGIPADNLRREIVGIAQTVTRDNDYETTWSTVMEAISEKIRDAKPFGRLTDDESKSDKIYQAIAKGDTEMLKRLKDSYKTEKAYESAMRQGLRDNDERIKAAAKAGHEGNERERVRICKEIIAEGLYSQDMVVKAVNAEISKLAKDEPEEETEDTPEYESDVIYKASDINDAIEYGDIEGAYEIINELVEDKKNKYLFEAEQKGERLSEREAEKKAKSSLKSTLTSHWKDKYIEAYESKDDAELKRIRTILADTGLWKRKSEVSEMCRDWLKDYRRTR